MAKQQFICIPGGTSDPAQLGRLEAWAARLSRTLKPGRFAHSLSVAATSVHLAEIHGLDVLRAEQAGLLHDWAKSIPPDKMRRIAEENRLTDDETILSNPGLLHSFVGAWVAENEYGMTDPPVLQAIRYHNTGFPGMTGLDMCVCLADSIEPLRKSYPMLEKVRVLAEASLARALLLSLESTSEYVTSKGWYLHPQTQDTVRWLRTLPEVRDAQ